MFIRDEDIYYIENFITTVFNYYNGKINTFQLAILDINWANLYDSNNAGTTTSPNKVIIYPNVILRHVKDINIFKDIVLNTIIHELYHIDQFILYPMLNNPAYRNRIENAVEFMVATYQANHTVEISSLLGHNFCIDNRALNAYINRYADGNIYNRCKFKDHLCSVIDALINDTYRTQYVINEITQQFNNPISRIYLNINNECDYVIKDKDLIIDVDEFNDILNKNIYLTNLVPIFNVLFEHNEDESLNINIMMKKQYILPIRKTIKSGN